MPFIYVHICGESEKRTDIYKIRYSDGNVSECHCQWIVLRGVLPHPPKHSSLATKQLNNPFHNLNPVLHLSAHVSELFTVYYPSRKPRSILDKGSSFMYTTNKDKNLW